MFWLIVYLLGVIFGAIAFYYANVTSKNYWKGDEDFIMGSAVFFSFIGSWLLAIGSTIVIFLRILKQRS